MTQTKKDPGGPAQPATQKDLENAEEKLRYHEDMVRCLKRTVEHLKAGGWLCGYCSTPFEADESYDGNPRCASCGGL